MTRVALSLLTMSLLTACPASAQLNSGISGESLLPSSRDLDRLNLTVAWKNFLPMSSKSDGLATVQIIEKQIFVQTRNNVLVVFDETTGDELSRIAMTKRNLPVFPVAVNRDVVLAVNGPHLHIYDRRNGKQKYVVDLPSTVAAGLAADQHQCFIVLSNERIVSVGLLPEDLRIGLRARKPSEQPEPPSGIKLSVDSAGELNTAGNRSPSLSLLTTLRPPFNTGTRDITPSLVITPTLRPPYRLETGTRSPSVQMMSNLSLLAQYAEINSEDKPRVLWELQANRRLDEKPLMYGEYLFVAGSDRSVFACSKYAERQNQIRGEYVADANISAPIAQYGSDLYLSLMDGNVYWFNGEHFRHADLPVKPFKRYLAGMPVDHKPVISDDSIYLVGSQSGLTRLDRKSFEKVWTNPEVTRLFAVNPNVIYAGDRRGNLIILDRARGLKLTSFDIRSFNYAITNDQDDRLFLASNNGTLLCLHERGMRRAEPLRLKEPKPPIDLREEIPRRKEADPKAMDPEMKKEEAKKDPEPKKEDEPKKDADPKSN